MRAAVLKISYQFPDTPDGRLMLGILNRAALDLLDEGHAREAERYIRNAPHAELCGVDPMWINEVFQRLECF